MSPEEAKAALAARYQLSGSTVEGRMTRQTWRGESFLEIPIDRIEVRFECGFLMGFSVFPKNDGRPMLTRWTEAVKAMQDRFGPALLQVQPDNIKTDEALKHALSEKWALTALWPYADGLKGIVTMTKENSAQAEPGQAESGLANLLNDDLGVWQRGGDALTAGFGKGRGGKHPIPPLSARQTIVVVVSAQQGDADELGVRPLLLEWGFYGWDPAVKATCKAARSKPGHAH